MDLSFPPDAPLLRFHHVGYACAKIDRELPFFQPLGYRCEGSRFFDPTFGVSGLFLVGGGPRLELLENLPGSSRLDPWLAQRVKCYHFAYEVADFAQAIPWFLSQRSRITFGPAPAVAFNGRPVVFLMMRNLQLIELIES
ncbi:MAG: VOC family protein [Hydrogenophilus sp.]|nr:VOC family protein [Hydrogenophilus sp.]